MFTCHVSAKSKQTNPAFTIIELIIVISILGIIIGISVPKIIGFQNNAKIVRASKEAATIMAALESYHAFNNYNYPSSTPTLQQTYLILTIPSILNKIIYDPFSSTSTVEYNYLCSSNGQYYVVWSVGVTGQNQPTGISNTGVISY